MEAVIQFLIRQRNFMSLANEGSLIRKQQDHLGRRSQRNIHQGQAALASEFAFSNGDGSLEWSCCIPYDFNSSFLCFCDFFLFELHLIETLESASSALKLKNQISNSITAT